MINDWNVLTKRFRHFNAKIPEPENAYEIKLTIEYTKEAIMVLKIKSNPINSALVNVIVFFMTLVFNCER